MSNQLRNNPAQSRYEMGVEGGTAFALYQSAPGEVMIYHTEVPRLLHAARRCDIVCMISPRQQPIAAEHETAGRNLSDNARYFASFC